MNNIKKDIYRIGLAPVMLTLAAFHVQAQTDLNIDFSTEHQIIDHFGASDAWSIDPAINLWMEQDQDEYINQLADLLFSPENGIGLSAWRFNIGAGSAEQGSDSNIEDEYRRAELLISEPGGAVDPNKQTGQIRLLQEAHNRGVKNFVAFVNSPPVWATKNGLAHPGAGSERESIGSTNLRDDAVDDFTAFLVDVVEYLHTDVGVPVNYISPINEPTWSWEGETQEANRYNNEDMTAVLKSLDNALDQSSLDQKVHIDAGEAVEYTAALSDEYKIQFDGSVYSGGANSMGFGSYKNYIDLLLGDDEMREIVGNHISMHGYWSDAWEDRMGELRDLTWENLQSVAPGSKVWMSEICILGGSGNVRSFEGEGFDVEDMDLALHVGKMIHRDLTRLNASAWHWWLGMTPYDYKDGLLKISSTLDGETIQDSKMMWTLGNFSRYIRPGSVRIDLPEVDDLNGLMASAYKSKNEDNLIVVVINAGDSEEEVSLNTINLPENKTLAPFQAFLTNADNELANQGSVTDNNYIVPARSTVTFVAPLGL